MGRILQQVLATGNQQFRGRYLFAGRGPTRAVCRQRNYVAYNGNRDDSQLRRRQLFVRCKSMQRVFGAISRRKERSPQSILTSETRLADLNNGRDHAGQRRRIRRQSVERIDIVRAHDRRRGGA